MAQGFVEPKDYPIYNDQANRAVDFVNSLSHTKGAHSGAGFNLRPWQELKIIRPIFGLINPDTGLRLIRTAYMEIPRKNGKTEICAALGLKMLCADNEPGAEVYIAASNREQASITFNMAAKMVRSHPILKDLCKVLDSTKTIIFNGTRPDDPRAGSFMKALSSEAYSKEGYSASAIIYDEVHAAPNGELWEVLNDSVGARSQPLTFAITTSGFKDPSLWSELREYAEKVRDGLIEDPSFLPILYSLPQEADPWDEKNWYLVNPALGDFKEYESMKILARQAQSMPSRENRFRRVQLCQKTEAENRAIPKEVWDACAGDFDPAMLEGRPCFVGIDLADTLDLSAVVLVFPFLEEKKYYVLPFFFCPESKIRTGGKTDKFDYSLWRNKGYIIATPGEVQDVEYIEQCVIDLGKIYDIREIAIDRWNATGTITRLQKEFGEEKVIRFGQGFFDMSAPSKRLEIWLKKQQLVHGDHPVLNWMISNLCWSEDAAGNIKPDKAKAVEKIDGAVALIEAAGRVIVHFPDESVYEERGVQVWG